MKKFFTLFLLMCVCVFSVGCNNQNITSSSCNSSITSKVNIQKIDIDPKEAGEPIGINGNYFYYMIGVDNLNNTSNYSFWQYNLSTSEKKKMGSIENFSTASATCAFVGQDKLFATFGLIENNIINNTHLMFDLKKCEMSILSKDNFFPPLVFSIPVNQTCFLEYQPKKLQEEAYEYQVSIGDKNGNMKKIIGKERSAAQIGDTISDVCVYANTIYTFEYSDKNRYICSYDLNGNEISRETNDILNKFLDTPDVFTGDLEILSNIKVINGYYFFSTMNGSKLVLHKSNGEYSKVENLSKNGIGIVDNTDCLDENDQKIILFDYDKKKLFCFDTCNGKLEELRITLENVYYMTTDGEKLVFLDNNHQFYFINDIFVHS